MISRKQKLERLKHSVFYDVLFPNVIEDKDTELHGFSLVRTIRTSIPDETLIKNLAFVILDVETTGLEKRGDRIIELAAYRLELDRTVRRFESLISIPGSIPEDITQLTGITNAMLRGAPRFEGIADEFLKFIEGAVLVGHNSQFDLGFIAEEYSRCGKALYWPTYCTLKMAKRVVPKLPSYKLEALANHFGYQFKSAHRALGDVDATFRVFVELMRIKKPQTLHDLRPYLVAQ